MTPYLGLRRLAAIGAIPLIVGRPRTAVAHLTMTTATHKPLCGQRGKRWTTKLDIHARRLCGRCARIVERRTQPVTLTPNEVDLELALALTEADVVNLRPAVIAANPTALVDGIRLHSRYAAARTRVRKAGR